MNKLTEHFKEYLECANRGIITNYARYYIKYPSYIKQITINFHIDEKSNETLS